MPRITILHEGQPLASYRITDQRITLGRSVDATIVLSGHAVSRLHAEIRYGDDGWVVEDLGSRNGTQLNRVELSGPASVVSGDRLGLGEYELLFDPQDDVASCSTREVRVRGSGTIVDEEIIAGAPAMREALESIERAAPTDATVLLTGETGTGKEVIARLLHDWSPRSEMPLEIVNCPALPENLIEAELFGVERGVATGVEPRTGRLEMADGGTVFLDEVGDLGASAQAKLLRFLQEKTIEKLGGRSTLSLDVRIVAATNEDLESAVDARRFRRDLYHRLNVVNVVLPPLRDRKEDLPALVKLFLSRQPGRRASITQEAMDVLLEHDFPGNVRELEHVVQSSRIHAGARPIDVSNLPRSLRLRDAPEEPTLPGSSEHQAVAVVEAPPRAAAEQPELSSQPDAPEAVPPDQVPVQAAALLRRITEEGGSFHELAQEPFIARKLDRDVVKELIRMAHERGGRSYRGAVQVLGIEGQYKPFLDFIRYHRLRVRD